MSQPLGRSLRIGRQHHVALGETRRYVVRDGLKEITAGRGPLRGELTPDPASGIDGAEETDGLAATSANLGPGFEQGLLVVQDGFNRLPEERQNFKLVPWRAVAAALNLPAPENK